MNRLFNALVEEISSVFTRQPKTVKEMKTLCTNPMEAHDNSYGTHELMLASRHCHDNNDVFYTVDVFTMGGGMLIKEEYRLNHFVRGEAEDVIKILKEWEESHSGRNKLTAEVSAQTLKNLCKKNNPSYMNFYPPLYHYSKAEELLGTEQKRPPTLQEQKPFL